MRLIDADELREDVDRTLNWNTNNEYNMYSDIMDMIDEAPTVEVINKDELLEKLYDKSGSTTDPRNTYQDMVYVRLEDVKKILEEYEVRQNETD